ncbi:MAG: RdgB/HAM1 family non-canonical purine NTP pyrophosphatase [Lachnospiraceae bacterium]|jgi:XTP/dITP diphosphohydrolase|nr:RdgB/HAM1 family non-canonical purine NTP pyrophosphatase [Lachnospiraceae bacterium]MCI1328714.1 RdgB/HAM1 family non-canonical purine NTP pyrophosphatase [Lachnospiraceae bacterium]
MKTIVFATGNIGKMREIREILKDLPCRVLSIKEAGIRADADENGATFAENAMIKAKAAAAAVPGSGLDPKETIVLADDSGLEIDALGKEPGVRSARYMGRDTSYHVKNAELIRRLEGVPADRRTARFVCEIAAVLPDGDSFTVRGTIEGKIGCEERGENGFGYDPIFYLSDMSRTTAELPMDEKNKISHRGAALRAVRKELMKRGIL